MEIRFGLNKRLWVGLLSVLLGAFVVWHSWGWDNESSSGQTMSTNTFPLLLGFGMLLTGSLLLLRARSAEVEQTGVRLLGPSALVLVSFVVSLKLIPYLGFFPVGFLFLLGMFLMLRGTAWWKAILLSGVIVFVIHSVFTRLLRVQFPSGEWFL